MQISPRSLLAASLFLLTAAVAALAGFTDWAYEWTASPFAVPANGGTRDGAITLELPGDAAAAPPVAPVTVRAFTALSGAVDRYDDAMYSLSFRISDPDSGQTHTLTVHGQFDGTVTSSRASLTNTFLGGSGLQSFDLLGRDFSVVFGFQGSAGPTWSWRGELTASVAVSSVAAAAIPAAVAPPPASAPEPAAFLLALLGLPALGFARRLRRSRPSIS